MKQQKLAAGWIYVLMTGIGIGLYLIIRHLGLDLSAPLREIPFVKAAGVDGFSVLGSVMVALGVIVLASRLFHRARSRYSQPQTIFHTGTDGPGHHINDEPGFLYSSARLKSECGVGNQRRPFACFEQRRRLARTSRRLARVEMIGLMVPP